MQVRMFSWSSISTAQFFSPQNWQPANCGYFLCKCICDALGPAARYLSSGEREREDDSQTARSFCESNCKRTSWPLNPLWDGREKKQEIDSLVVEILIPKNINFSQEICMLAWWWASSVASSVFEFTLFSSAFSLFIFLCLICSWGFFLYVFGANKKTESPRWIGRGRERAIQEEKEG